MARRKNVKRIDPRYFLNETVNRGEENLEEIFGFSQKEKFAKKVKGILAQIDKAAGKYGGRPVHDRIKEPFAMALAKGADQRTAKMSYLEALEAYDLEQEEYQAVKQVYAEEETGSDRDARRAKEKRMSDRRTQADIDATNQRGKDAQSTAKGAGALKDFFDGYNMTLRGGSLKKNMKSGDPGLAQELLRDAEAVQRYAQGRDKQKLAGIIQDLQKFAGEAGIEDRRQSRPSTSRTGGYGSAATDKYRWHKE